MRWLRRQLACMHWCAHLKRTFPYDSIPPQRYASVTMKCIYMALLLYSNRASFCFCGSLKCLLHIRSCWMNVDCFWLSPILDPLNLFVRITNVGWGERTQNRAIVFCMWMHEQETTTTIQNAVPLLFITFYHYFIRYLLIQLSSMTKN